jgi:hypothetical protein
MSTEDERMLWSMSKPRRRELERLAKDFGFTVMEVLELARAFVARELDPAPGKGEIFEFFRPDFVMPDYFDHAAVPPADAKVDVLEAREHWKDDTRACSELLKDAHPPLATRIAALANSLAWSKFWAQRHNRAEEREWHKAQAAEHEAVLKRLLVRAERIERRRALRAMPPEGSA